MNIWTRFWSWLCYYDEGGDKEYRQLYEETSFDDL